MKKILFIAVLCVSTIVGISAKENKENLNKMTIQMNKLWKSGAYLEAMDTATLVLSIDENNHTAKEFIHSNWDKMQRRAKNELNRLNDADDLDEAYQRCEIYRLLDEINSNLRVVRMPLEGHHQSWVWQPKIEYYAGHYDNERTKTYRLLIKRTEQALADRDIESARQFTIMATDRYLITAGEKKKCKKEVAQMCNQRLQKVQKSTEIHDAIYAYDLCTLSLELNSEQAELKDLQPTLQNKVSELYKAQAEQLLQQGDSVRANEFLVSAQEWGLTEEND